MLLAIIGQKSHNVGLLFNYPIKDKQAVYLNKIQICLVPSKKNIFM